MKQWTIRQRILASFGVILTLMVIMAVVAYSRLIAIHGQVDNVEQHSLPGLYSASTLQRAWSSDFRIMQDLLLQQDPVERRHVSRRTDTAGRIGGEEFAMLLPETGIGGAEELARRITEACRSTPIDVAERTVPFTCSIGLAAAGPDDASFDEMLRRADLALYEAKRQGRDRWVVAG